MLATSGTVPSGSVLDCRGDFLPVRWVLAARFAFARHVRHPYRTVAHSRSFGSILRTSRSDLCGAVSLVVRICDMVERVWNCAASLRTSPSCHRSSCGSGDNRRGCLIGNCCSCRHPCGVVRWQEHRGILRTRRVSCTRVAPWRVAIPVSRHPPSTLGGPLLAARKRIVSRVRQAVDPVRFSPCIACNAGRDLVLCALLGDCSSGMGSD